VKLKWQPFERLEQLLTPISAQILDTEAPQVLPKKDLARTVELEFQRPPRTRDFSYFRHASKRFLVRTTRIAVGLVIGVLSLWPLEFAFKALEQPFSALSPVNLIVSGLAAVLGIAAVVWAPRIAFGEGGSREMLDAGPKAKSARQPGGAPAEHHRVRSKVQIPYE
jgi:hypothetical protein